MEKNDELNKKIEDAIKDSMPSKVGDELKKLLEQGKNDAAKVIQLTNQNIDLSKTISTLNEKLTNYAKLDQRNATLEAREKKVEEDERDLKVKTLEFQLAASQSNTQFAKDVALGLVRNTEYRKSTFDTTNQAGYSNGSTWIQPTPIEESHNETSEAK